MKKLAISAFLALTAAQSVAAVTAFPGAEGFGANTIGGRGGTVMKVTNLNDSGAGSLRACVEASGPRICVFETSGIINLASQLTISNPYITIAGQTSPGGILVTGYMTLINASEVIVRHMRFRVGSHRIASGADPETLDSLDIWGPDTGSTYTENVIVDHCSVGWGVDENFSTAYRIRKVTISWNLVHEGLTNAGHPKGQHSKGLFVWAKFSPNATVTLHHNFLAHNYDRNPLVNTGDATQVVDVVNNVTYNPFGGYAMGSDIDTGEAGLRVNWRHNYVKRGPDTNSSLYEIYHEAFGGSPTPLIYVKGNIGVSRTAQGGSEWTVAESWQDILQDTAWQKTTPWPAPPVTTTTMTSTYAATVVANAGATKPSRDTVDAQMATYFTNATGTYRTNVSYPTDFPTYSTPSAPTDTDGDGMPDSWETSKGLNNSSNDSASDRDSDGYTNIEEYINYMAGDYDVVRPRSTTVTVN